MKRTIANNSNRYKNRTKPDQQNSRKRIIFTTGTIGDLPNHATRQSVADNKIYDGYRHKLQI